MRIVFAGSPEIACPLLEALLHSPHEIVGVYTQPDKQKGRGKVMMPTPVKALALKHHLPVCTPVNFKRSETIDELKALAPDVMVVMAYGLILPDSVLSIPTHGALNVHVSLLPKYRGASPIQAALLNGEQETGVSIMQMDKGLDTGDVLSVKTCDIQATDTSLSLHDKLAVLSLEPLLGVLDCLQRGDGLNKVVQDDAKASFAPKINKQDALIDWQLEAAILERKVRAYYPWPVAYFKFEETLIKVLEASWLEEANGHPGEVLQYNREGLIIACGQGALCIQKLQMPGKKALSIGECFNGRADLFKVGLILETSSVNG